MPVALKKKKQQKEKDFAEKISLMRGLSSKRVYIISVKNQNVAGKWRV